MVKINEIIDSLIADPKAPFSEKNRLNFLKTGKNMGELNLAHGKYPVYSIPSKKNEVDFAVFYEENMIAVFAVQEVTNKILKLIEMVVNREQYPDQTKELATTFVSWLNRDHQFSIMCDDELTADGLKFWKKLVNNSQNAKIYDIKTGEMYNKSSSVNNEIVSGDKKTLIQNPEEDKPYTDYEIQNDVPKEIKRKERSRFYWLLEELDNREWSHTGYKLHKEKLLEFTRSRAKVGLDFSFDTRFGNRDDYYDAKNDHSLDEWY